MKPLVVQMHGEPGAGKTTLARALAPRIPAIHIDKDVVMTAMVQSRLPREVAGPLSYETIWALGRSLVEQGYSIIVDSPAYWPQVEGSGRGVASATGASYAMIEVRCANTREIERRLATREGLETNPSERHNWLAIPGTREPTRARLVLDGELPVARLVCQALDYLAARREE
jgi:predicted kinase